MTITAYPALVSIRTISIDQLMERIGIIPNDNIIPFVWSAEISSQRLDAYYTHMDETSLRNFATDALAGVSFLDSHDSRKLGYGQSFDGKFEVNNGVSRTVADFYTVPGIRFGGIHSYESTDDFIRAVQSRIARDVSVGFYDGRTVCDICGEPMYGRTDCPHWPGMEYAIGEQGKDTTIATGTIYDARLAEVSAVYDGATPEAMILKAERMMRDGKMEPKALEYLNTQYRIKVPDNRQWSGVEIPKINKINGENAMTEKVEQVVVNIRSVLAEALPDAGDDILATLRLLVDERATDRAEIKRLTTEVERLQPLADDGKAYRDDLVNEALAAGVRALGDQFPEETYRGMLEGATLEHIKKVRDTFMAQAKGTIPSGRHVNDETNDDPAKPVNTGVPDAAYG